MKTLLCITFLACHAQAGVLRHFIVPVAKVVTYPVRHPVKTIKAPAKVISYPFRHPKKTFIKHGPTLPPDPWSDARNV